MHVSVVFSNYRADVYIVHIEQMLILMGSSYRESIY